jgi:hypothetical protein
MRSTCDPLVARYALYASKSSCAVHCHTQAVIEFSVICILHELSSEPRFMKATDRNSR